MYAHSYDMINKFEKKYFKNCVLQIKCYEINTVKPINTMKISKILYKGNAYRYLIFV